MAKLLLVRTLFLAICWYTVVSGEIKNSEELKKLLAEKVAPKFLKWAHYKNKRQFAVLMLMDTAENWQNFKLNPEPSTNFKSLNQPAPDNRHNYIAAIPGMMDGVFKHAEQRIYDYYLKTMWEKYEDEHGEVPKAMILYSWIVPCIERKCLHTGEDVESCTKRSKRALKTYAKETKVIIAYSNEKKSKSKLYECNYEKTTEELDKVGIDVIYVPAYKEEQEAMMESLIKLGRLLQILE